MRKTTSTLISFLPKVISSSPHFPWLAAASVSLTHASPPLTSVLNGITRQTVLDYFKHKDTPIAGDRFTRDELYTADEAFMTGTAAEITPIQSLDMRMIGAGKPGPITKQLQSDYQKIVRGELKLPYMKNWWTKI